MRIKGAVFLTSAAMPQQFLSPEKPVIAVCGKSNSGKSTLINLLANQKNLARTSASPGRTRLVNYFDFGEFLLADLPGYGYAAVSKAEQAKWGRTMDAFFAEQKKLAHVFLLSDIRRDPSEDDRLMVEFLNCRIVPFTVVATKADKLSRMKRRERARAIANAFRLGEGNVVVLSALTGEGKDDLIGRIAQVVESGAE